MEAIKPQPVEPNPQRQTAQAQKKRGKRLLTKKGNQALEAKFVLDALVEQGAGLPEEVKKAIASARDACWSHFKSEQEAQMKLV